MKQSTQLLFFSFFFTSGLSVLLLSTSIIILYSCSTQSADLHNLPICTICRFAQSADRQFMQPDCTIWCILLLHAAKGFLCFAHSIITSSCRSMFSPLIDFFIHLIVGENVYWWCTCLFSSYHSIRYLRKILTVWSNKLQNTPSLSFPWPTRNSHTLMSTVCVVHIIMPLICRLCALH